MQKSKVALKNRITRRKNRAKRLAKNGKGEKKLHIYVVVYGYSSCLMTSDQSI